jgi:hypothetical protein
MVGDLLGVFVDGALSNLHDNVARSPVIPTILTIFEIILQH